MDEINPGGEQCLTAEERRELQAAWREFQAELEPFGAMVARAEMIDCADLHDAFLRLVDVFEEVERAVMRARQIRLLTAARKVE